MNRSNFFFFWDDWDALEGCFASLWLELIWYPNIRNDNINSFSTNYMSTQSWALFSLSFYSIFLDIKIKIDESWVN